MEGDEGTGRLADHTQAHRRSPHAHLGGRAAVEAEVGVAGVIDDAEVAGAQVAGPRAQRLGAVALGGRGHRGRRRCRGKEQGEAGQQGGRTHTGGMQACACMQHSIVQQTPARVSLALWLTCGQVTSPVPLQRSHSLMKKAS